MGSSQGELDGEFDLDFEGEPDRKANRKANGEVDGKTDGSLRDFAADIKIDFHKPRVLENIEEIKVQPNPQIIKNINVVIDEMLQETE